MRLLRRVLAVLLLGGLGFAAWLGWFALRPLSLAAPLEFSIPPGLGLKAAAVQISRAGAGFAPWQFSLLGRLAGKAGEIKAGSYELQPGTSPWQLLAKLSRGDVTQAEIVFVEGRTFGQWRAVLDTHPDLRHDSRGMSDGQVLAAIGAGEAHPEGLFFPDTYLFAKGSSDLEVLRRAYRAMQKHLGEAWATRDPALPYATPYEALIMASIVEKETGAESDRALVAAVFVNRLRQGMLLQTDPAVIYGLGSAFDGNLRKRDLTADGPYNTYTRTGLPPTPIAMPGLAALAAATRPAASEMLYFVARGDGSSAFSRSLEEHNRAVNRYQRRRGER